MSKTHDYTQPSWEHDCTFEPVDGGTKGMATGWGEGIVDGDFLLLQNGQHSTRYQVKHIKYQRDPQDMWRAELNFAPREENTHANR